MAKDTRSRKWQVTINNPSDQGMDQSRIKFELNDMELMYSCLGDHIGEEGTYHTHVFLQGNNQIRFSTIKNKFPGAHIEMGKGTAQQNRDYILGEGVHAGKKKGKVLPETFLEIGECPVERPGRRSDLDDLYDMIREGKTNKEIMDEDSRYMLHLDKIERARQIVVESEYRDIFRKMETSYLWGPTETGKTRGVMEKNGYGNVHRVTDYEHPWDSYRQQRVVIFEEFRSSLKIQDMLNYLDGYPLELPCRYVNKIACFTEVYIISNIAIDEQYPQIQREQPKTWDAFRRRVQKVQYFYETEEMKKLRIVGCPF